MKLVNDILVKQFTLLKGMYLDTLKDEENYILYSSNLIDDNFWNFVSNINTNELLTGNLLKKIECDFKNINREPCIYIPNFIDKYKDIEDYLLKNSYQIGDHDAFMILKENNFKDDNQKKEIVKINSDKEVKDYLEVLNSAYGGEVDDENPYAGSISSGYEKAIRQSLNNNENKFYHFILYYNNIPASVATLIYKDGYGGIYNVGTKKEYQNLGLGKQVMKKCIDEFNNLGGKILYLFTEANSKNEKWYYNHGFQTVFVNNQFVKK